MAAPITITLPVEHADAALAALTSPASFTGGGAPMMRLPVAPPRITPAMARALMVAAPGRRMAPQTLGDQAVLAATGGAGPSARRLDVAAPAGAPPPAAMAAPTITSLPAPGPRMVPLDSALAPGIPVVPAQNTGFWHDLGRVMKPVAEGLGTTFAPAALPFIPGTPQHEAMQQYLQGRGQQLRQNEGEIPGHIASATGAGQEAAGRGAIEQQLAAAGMGTTQAGEQRLTELQQGLGYGAEAGALGQPTQAVPGITTRPASLESMLGPEPPVLTTGSGSDEQQNAQAWQTYAAKLKSLAGLPGIGGFVGPEADLASQRASQAELLAREQNPSRVAAMPQLSAKDLAVVKGIMAGMPANTDPSVVANAVLQAERALATANVAPRGTSAQRAITTPSGEQVMGLTTTTGAGAVPTVGGGAALGVPRVQGGAPGAGVNAAPLIVNGLPTPPKINASEQQQMESLQNVVTITNQLIPAAEALMNNGQNSIVGTKAKQFLYDHGLNVSNPASLYNQLTGLSQVIGGGALTKGMSRSLTNLEKAYSHLGDAGAQPSATLTRVKEIKELYPQLISTIYTNAYGDSAGAAAVMNQLNVDLPGIYHALYGPSPASSVPIFKYRGKWYERGMKPVAYTGQ